MTKQVKTIIAAILLTASPAFADQTTNPCENYGFWQRIREGCNEQPVPGIEREDPEREMPREEREERREEMTE